MEALWIYSVLVFGCVPCSSILLVIPEDLATALAGIYGFTPRLLFGQDHRFGFGFRFGNHADLQVQYELGPQAYTRPLQPVTRVRSASYRQRIVRRRPFIEFLLRAGILKESAYEVDVVYKDGVDNIDEPR